MITSAAPTDALIEKLLQAQYQRATELLQSHRSAFGAMVTALIARGSLESAMLCALLSEHGIAARNALAKDGDELLTESFASRWECFLDTL